MTTVTFVEEVGGFSDCGDSTLTLNLSNLARDYIVLATNGTPPAGFGSSGAGTGLSHRTAQAANESIVVTGGPLSAGIYAFALVFRPDDTDYIITDDNARSANGSGFSPVTAHLDADATAVMLRVYSLADSGYSTNIGCGQYDGSSLSGPTGTWVDGATCGTCGTIVEAGDQHATSGGIGYQIGGVGDIDASVSMSGENSLGGQEGYEVYLREVIYTTIFNPPPAPVSSGWGILTS